MNTDIKKIVKFFSGKHVKSTPRQFSPEKDWSRMAFYFVIANIVVVAWSAYIFFFAQVADMSNAAATVILKTSLQDESKINKILTSFNSKTEKTTSILQQKPHISDPS